MLGLSVFRYYDVDNAESVTYTGRDTIKYTQIMGDKIYNDIMNTSDVDYIKIETNNGEPLSVKPTKSIPVIRENVKQNVHAANIREGDQLCINELFNG